MSTQPSRRPSGRDDDSVPSGAGRADPGADGARESRLAAVVEAFLRAVRGGGALDPEPYLRRCEDLRADLEPLLLGVLRLESLANALDGSRGMSASTTESSSGPAEGLGNADGADERGGSGEDPV